MSTFNELGIKYHNTYTQLLTIQNEIINKCTIKFNKLDKDNSGYISIGEYLNSFFEKNKDTDYNITRDLLDNKLHIFENADTNKDGYVSLEEAINLQFYIMNIKKI